MISVLIQSEILHGCVVAIQVRESAKSEGVPHNNVSFLTATGNESVLGRVNEGVYTLLMKIEGLIILVIEVFNIMDVNLTVQRRGYNVV